MSRIEGDFAAIGDARLGGDELLALIRGQGALPHNDLQEAIACYLSSSEGWDQALKVLRGAFANDVAHASQGGAQGARPRSVKQNERDVNQRASEYLQRPGLKPIGNDNV